MFAAFNGAGTMSKLVVTYVLEELSRTLEKSYCNFFPEFSGIFFLENNDKKRASVNTVSEGQYCLLQLFQEDAFRSNFFFEGEEK